MKENEEVLNEEVLNEGVTEDVLVDELDDNTVNIEDFFSEEREEKGVWFEPTIDGVPCGIEFLVTGIGTDENVAASERYERRLKALKKIEDPVERSKQGKILDANRVAEFVRDIRAKKGQNVLFGGQPLKYSKTLVQQILYKAPLLKAEIARFAVNTANFIKKVKNA